MPGEFCLSLDQMNLPDDFRREVTEAVRRRSRILLVGPPGSGKTMLARRLWTLLPPLTEDEREDARRQAVAAGVLKDGIPWTWGPPFRAPHHTVSAIAMFGTRARPVGEVHLATYGTLFLDEVPEFRGDVLRRLLDVVQTGVAYAVDAPLTFETARGTPFLLVGSTNACPCGYLGSPTAMGRRCACSLEAQDRYLARIPTGLFQERFFMPEWRP